MRPRSDSMAASDRWCPGKIVGPRAGPLGQGKEVGPRTGPSGLLKVLCPHSFPPSYIWFAIAAVSFHGIILHNRWLRCIMQLVSQKSFRSHEKT